MLFVIFRNMYDYLSVTYEGYTSQYDKYEVLLDKKVDAGMIGNLNGFHNSVSINRRVLLPFKNIWYSRYVDYERIDAASEKEDKIIFVFFEGNRLAYQKEYLNYLKMRYPKAVIVFRFVNVINDHDFWVLEFVKKKYDILISMDKRDCERYGLNYCPNTFWINEGIIPDKPKSDVVYIGMNKGRLNELIEIYKVFSEQGLNCRFYLSGNMDSLTNIPDGIEKIDSMRYLDYLGYVKNSKCILELVIPEQRGSTLRSVESIFFNKKLISNNKYIRDEDYYCKDKMLIYSNPVELKEVNAFFENQEVDDNKELIDHDRLLKTIEGLIKR